jgi:hypothetical protein
MSETGENERQIRPIQYWFVLRTVPQGSAPEEIKEQWLGVPLPCRRPFIEGSEQFLGFDAGAGLETLKIVEDGVAVEADDAIVALNLFGKEEAARWWDNICGQVGAELVFRVVEGQAIPTTAAERTFPQIINFDNYRKTA